MCQGDSGGGLYAYDQNISKFVVVGVTSNGYECALSGYPRYFSKLVLSIKAL